MSLFIAWLKYIGWMGVKLVMGSIYVAVISEGLRILVPALGQKIYKMMSVLHHLKTHQIGHMDPAPFFAVLLLLLSWLLMGHIIHLWIESEDRPLFEGRTQFDKLVFFLATVIVASDSYLFYRSIATMSWGGGFSLSSLLATAAYIAVLISISLISVMLWKGIQREKDRSSH